MALIIQVPTFREPESCQDVLQLGKFPEKATDHTQLAYLHGREMIERHSAFSEMQSTEIKATLGLTIPLEFFGKDK